MAFEKAAPKRSCSVRPEFESECVGRDKVALSQTEGSNRALIKGESGAGDLCAEFQKNANRGGTSLHVQFIHTLCKQVCQCKLDQLRRNSLPAQCLCYCQSSHVPDFVFHIGNKGCNDLTVRLHTPPLGLLFRGNISQGFRNSLFLLKDILCKVYNGRQVSISGFSHDHGTTLLSHSSSIYHN